MKEVYQVDYLTSADQKTIDWSIKITFLEEAEIAMKLGIKF